MWPEEPLVMAPSWRRGHSLSFVCDQPPISTNSHGHGCGNGHGGCGASKGIFPIM